MSSNPVQNLLIELEDYIIYSKYLLESKGVTMSPEDCYRMVQWFKGASNVTGSPSQAAIFRAGHQIAKYMIFSTDQMYDLYEIYYVLSKGLSALPKQDLPIK